MDSKIKQLKLIDFQAHKSFVLDLDPLVTTLCGKSDIGKSSIIRSIRWLALNRPAGDAFIRHGKSRTTAILRTKDHSIYRKKGKGLNAYKLDDKELKAFGVNVPSEVQELLKLGDVNFARQHEAPFWFMKSPGEVSKELNSIINLGLIDKTLANLASRLRETRAEATVSESRLAESRTEREQLAWVKEADAELKVVEKQENVVKQLKEKLTAMHILLETILEAEQCTEAPSRKEIDALDAQASIVQKLQAKLANVKTRLAEITSREKEACRLDTLARQSAARLEKLSSGKCPLCGRPK